VEAPEVVIELGLALAEGIHRHPEARRPLAGKAVGVAGAALGQNRADHPLLFPAIAEQRSDEAVEPPGVLHVSRVIIRLRVEGRIAELAANLP